MFLKHSLQSERDLISSMGFLAKMKAHEGCSGRSIECYHLFFTPKYCDSFFHVRACIGDIFMPFFIVLLTRYFH